MNGKELVEETRNRRNWNERTLRRNLWNKLEKNAEELKKYKLRKKLGRNETEIVKLMGRNLYKKLGIE